VSEPKLPIVKMILWFPFAIALMAGGLPLFFMPMIFPLGIVMMVLAALPYARWFSKKIHADMAYAERDHTLNEKEPKPWESEDGSVSEDEIIDIIINSTGRGA
jgi:hypothetical protein